MDLAETQANWPPGGPRDFRTTHWSIVLLAGQTGSPTSGDALEKLCRTYWYPLYGYVRRMGNSPADAQDLTQEFFARFLDRNYIALANPERGRFRTFLLTSLKHFLINEWAKARTARRGGKDRFLPWEEMDAEGRFLAEPADHFTPELAFEKRWAATLLEQVLARLRAEAAAANRVPLFERLKDYLWGDSAETTYPLIAREFGMSETAVKGASHRLRQRFRELLRAEIADTVANHEDIEDELRHLIQVISL